jgi:hypothetical protein
VGTCGPRATATPEALSAAARSSPDAPGGGASSEPPPPYRGALARPEYDRGIGSAVGAVCPGGQTPVTRSIGLGPPRARHPPSGRVRLLRGAAPRGVADAWGGGQGPNALHERTPTMPSHAHGAAPQPPQDSGGAVGVSTTRSCTLSRGAPGGEPAAAPGVQPGREALGPAHRPTPPRDRSWAPAPLARHPARMRRVLCRRRYGADDRRALLCGMALAAR